MKKIIQSLFFLVLGIVITVLSLSYFNCPWKTKSLNVARLSTILHFNDQQKFKAQQIENTYLQNKTQTEADLAKRKSHLTDLLTKSDTMADQVRAQAELVSAAQARLEQLRVDFLISIRDLLTSDQKSDFKKLLKENTTSSEPACFFMKLGFGRK